ncbi:stretch-activated Ca2+-permeable channel component-domain-containing protein [Kockiozyma suomiensis]|uniref:stretch-activated Ca2+-permeable channel component-domain-containing protein n=1 Tax=Kockiozyma suomiensis TaxID=1337062 RepID=UPI00334316AF
MWRARSRRKRSGLSVIAGYLIIVSCIRLAAGDWIYDAEPDFFVLDSTDKALDDASKLNALFSDELDTRGQLRTGYFDKRLSARDETYTALETQVASSYIIGRGDKNVWRYTPTGDNAKSESYIIATVCKQPTSRKSETPSENKYISDLALNFRGTASSANTISFDGLSSFDTNGSFSYGFYSAMWDATSKNIFVEITAPSYDQDDWEGDWTVQVLATTFSNIAGFSNTTSLFALDTDYNSALFLTAPTPENSTDSDENNRPYRLYVYTANTDTSLIGLNYSYCAITSGSHFATDGNADVDTTTHLWDLQQRETMHLKGLASATDYVAYLVEPDTIISNVGTTYPAVQFTTKMSDTCQIIYNLDFCSEVAYSAPSNSSMSMTALSNWYDGTAQSLYDGFNKSLQLSPCDAPSHNQYTMMRTCADCRSAYKRWLCLTLIPRCYPDTTTDLPVSTRGSYEGGWEDKTVNGTVEREPGYSRNEMINLELKPGSYLELLPCSYTCHKVMQNCPSDLTFLCPTPGKGLYDVYGRLNADVANGEYFSLENATCNFLGFVDKFGAGNSLSVNLRMIVGIAFISSILMLV